MNARIPDADDAAFQKAAGDAKAGCPVSKVLNAKITMTRTLETIVRVLRPLRRFSVEIRATQVEATLRTFQFAAVVHEFAGAIRTEARRVGGRIRVRIPCRTSRVSAGRSGQCFAQVRPSVHSAITSPNKKESRFAALFLHCLRQCQNPGMNEYPIEIAYRDALTLLNS